MNGKQSVSDIITDTARETAKAYQTLYLSATNYYKSMESLLYNYPTLCRILADAESYMTTERHERSKDIVVAGTGGTVSADERADMEAQQRARQYLQTLERFEDLDRVIRMHYGRKEFPIIRMYYFNQTPDGKEREPDSARYTWDEIAACLSDSGILRDEKTARRWRTHIVSDMAVCMFGAPAAVSLGSTRGNARIAPDARP